MEDVVVKMRSDTDNLFVTVLFVIGNDDCIGIRNGAISCPNIIKLGSSTTCGQGGVKFRNSFFRVP